MSEDRSLSDSYNAAAEDDDGVSGLLNSLSNIDFRLSFSRSICL